MKRLHGSIVHGPLIPLHNDTGDLGGSEDVENVWSGISNGAGVGSVRTNSDPDDDRAKGFLLAVLDHREPSSLERRVLEAPSFHRRYDPRSESVPHVIKWRVKDAVGSLLGDLVETGASRGDGEGVRLEIGTPQELRRVTRDAVVVEVHLVFGDQIGGDDGTGV